MAGSTFVAALLLSPRIDLAVLLGLVLAVAVHLWRELGLEVEAFVEGDDLHLAPVGVLWFGSAPRLEETLLELLASQPEARGLILDLTRLGRVDLTGAHTVESVIQSAEDAGLEVRLKGVPPGARRLLDPR